MKVSTPLYVISRDINGTLSSEDLLNKIMDHAIEFAGADRGLIILKKQEGDDFEIKVARNMDKESLRGHVEHQ